MPPPMRAAAKDYLRAVLEGADWRPHAATVYDAAAATLDDEGALAMLLAWRESSAGVTVCRRCGDERILAWAYAFCSHVMARCGVPAPPQDCFLSWCPGPMRPAEAARVPMAARRVVSSEVGQSCGDAVVKNGGSLI